ncbi:MAG TPA: hypothetical protein VGI90_00810 [Steroidobacteraceae bacterium]|jgi:ElaB/YqjD/DUF883 family membrane-anchored ribosome-binding protein
MDKSKRLDELVGRVDELLVRLPDGPNPDLAALRDRVDAEILMAWTAISLEAARRRESIGRAARRPWTIVGVALLVGVCASFLLSGTALSRGSKQG